MSFVLVRLSNNERSDRGGGRPYPGTTSGFDLPRYYLREMEEAREAFLTTNSSEDPSSREHHKQIYEAALRFYHEWLTISSKYNQDSVLDYQMNNMEQSSRHFFRPISTNPIDITLRFTDHWGAIMGDQSSTAGLPLHPCAQKQAILIHSITKTLTSSNECLFSSPLTKKEMEEAIKHIRGYSSPGMDRLPAAFYQLAPSVFGECLQIVLDYQLRRGTLLRSQRSSEVTLLYNEGSRADPGTIAP
uniref:AlNc14C332G10705 protein n=1 Tax=Albugo laibachii Nc14 TaxID=890382 RepID=F0WWU2_9STRA|nr:AlNc14C332G10705 [Albugo laibachii Nc14]|eukprot:CCA25919.1 AlNc14C332G10705 [Albugo laibachii Nc14]